MLTCNLTNPEGPVVTASLSTPSVYLDHFALRKISSSDIATTKFTRAVRQSGGTLVISWLSLAEFTTVTDKKQVQLANQMIQQAMPNIYPLQVDTRAVVQREDLNRRSTDRIAPQIDEKLLEQIVKCSLNSGAVHPVSSFDLLDLLEGQKLAMQFGAMRTRIAEDLAAIRQKSNTEAELAKLVRRPTAPPQSGSAATVWIYREALKLFLSDKRRNIPETDATDLYHTIVPAAYCDFIVLDGAWAHIVEQMRQKAVRLGLEIAIAEPIRAGSLEGEALAEKLCERLKG